MFLAFLFFININQIIRQTDEKVDHHSMFKMYK